MKRELQEAPQRPVTQMPSSSTLYGQSAGRGFGYHNTGVPVPPPFQVPGNYSAGNMGQSGGYGASPAGGYAPMPTPLPDPSQGPTPWTWNNASASGTAAPGANPASAPLPQMSGGLPVPGGSASYGSYPYGRPPFPRAPAGPVFEISPGARTLIVTVLVGIVLGGSIAGGVIAFLHSYDQYRLNVRAQQVSTLMGKGVAAYNGQDYNTAANWFRQALNANPSASDRAKIVYNLAATYIQTARAAEKQGDLNAAKQAYQQALDIAPDNQMAHSGLANILDRLGDASGARQERDAAQNSSNTTDTPGKLQPFVSNGDASTGTDAQQFVADRRAEAQRLIQEGDDLYKQRDVDGAREKWQEAISAAPGTPERDQAKQRLDQTESAPDFSGQ